ncbi:MAG: hypothetical protein KIT79_02745 [Deltaproteobacteria bacterium]|nr:hypothetical protein [Deltaproteobacteria bacterium]
MSDEITMGNDEFILHLRKRYKWGGDNRLLGEEIWRTIQELDNNARQEPEGKATPVLWPTEGENIAPDRLPTAAHQFVFNREILPDLYRRLGEIGKRIKGSFS